MKWPQNKNMFTYLFIYFFSVKWQRLLLLADRIATHRLLASSCHPSVCLSVCLQCNAVHSGKHYSLFRMWAFWWQKRTDGGCGNGPSI